MAHYLSDEARARVAAVWPDLLARIANGDRIGDVLQALGLTRDAVRAYRVLVDKADEEYEQARKDSAASLFEDLRDLARRRSKDQVEAADKRAEMDITRWMIQKLDPKNYSDKAQLDVNVKTMDLTRIVEAANARLIAHHAPITINSVAARPVTRAGDVQDAELVPTLADLQ